MTSPLLLVGGGLQNALIALAILRKDPDASLVLLERETRLGGNHTWSFQASDLPPAITPVVEPLVVRRWPGHTLAFPAFTRSVETPYASITSDRLHHVLTRSFRSARRAELRLDTAVARIEDWAVWTSSGERFVAGQVIDARGPGPVAGRIGYQKFLGLELRLKTSWPHPLPCLMDARVEQIDGFRFVYTLPLETDRILVEDTVYSTSPVLDAETMRARIGEYVAQQGVEAAEVLREEQGVLPLPMQPFSPNVGRPLSGGYAGGWFHPTTGYSLPVAARLAELIAEEWPAFPSPDRLSRLARTLSVQIRFCALLNRLLFEATSEYERWRVLERFHRLPRPTVERFYALRTTRSDRLRILVGRPPHGVSWSRAALALGEA